jgi:hypothetical protein
MKACGIRLCCRIVAPVAAVLLLTGCGGSTSYGVSYSSGYYWPNDRWYYHDHYYPGHPRPPRPPAYRPRPEHPVARPPVRPTPLPARPMPRPAPPGRMR